MDHLFKFAIMLAGLYIIFIILLMAFKLGEESYPVFERFGLNFIFGTEWDAVNDIYGALPYILGTLITSAIALLIGVPISIGIAMYLVEMAPSFIRSSLSFLIELLAAVPSVIYGLWGLFTLRPILVNYIETPLYDNLGFIPLFADPPFGLDIFSASIILSIMIIPTISAISREVVAAVPNTQREASYSLGATKWEVFRHAVIPYAKSGLIGATILGLGRAVGETMAVTMLIGNAIGEQAMPYSLFHPGQTMASIIANEFNEASPFSLHIDALIGVGMVLLIVAITINVGAVILVSRMVKGNVE